MKTVRLILAFACLIWIVKPSHAVQDSTREQSSAVSSSATDQPKDRPQPEAADEEPVHRRAPANRQSRRGGTATPGNRLQQIPKREAAPDSRAVNARSAVLGESGRAAREGFAQNEILNGSALPTRPTRIDPGRAVTANNPRHRDPNPAVVDGSMNTNTRNTGAINGTHMVRKH